MNNKKEFKVFAAVDPEYLKKVSAMLKRDLAADKDTANYNSQVISNLIDKTSISLRDSGQKEIAPGDAMKISEGIDSIIQKREVNEELFDHKLEFNYDLDHSHFSHKLEQEQRTKHILRTEALDTFESLMDELDVYMPRFVSMDNWLKLKMAISKGNDRLATNNLIFIGPEVYLGKEMRLSTKEMERLGFSLETGNLSYDLRPNGPDLLAMKELVRVLKGGIMEDLSFAPGFFAKYTHELSQSKIASVIFKTENNKLTSIEIFEITNDINRFEVLDEYRANCERFSPAKALCLLARKLSDTAGSQDEKKLLESFKANEKYYLVFHGYISSPNENNHFGYEKNPPLNEKPISSGEVFLVKKVSDKILTTRIYFVPENYSHFHPYHQHGSVIIGNNDYSYHSTAQTKFFLYRSIFLKEMYVNNLMAIFEPSFIFGLVKKFPGVNDPEHYFSYYSTEEFTNALMNLYEETPLVFDFLIKGKMPSYFINHNLVNPPTDEENLILDKKEADATSFAMKHLVKNYAPLHKKWTLRQYLKDGSGIVETRVPGLVDDLATEAKGNQAMKTIAEMAERFEKMKKEKK